LFATNSGFKIFKDVNLYFVSNNDYMDSIKKIYNNKMERPAHAKYVNTLHTNTTTQSINNVFKRN
jgi:hypothetical protein